jgi:hypothetical protein
VWRPDASKQRVWLGTSQYRSGRRNAASNPNSGSYPTNNGDSVWAHNANTYADCYGDGNCHCYAECDSDTDGYSYNYSISDTYGYTKSHAESSADTAS